LRPAVLLLLPLAVAAGLVFVSDAAHSAGACADATVDITPLVGIGEDLVQVSEDVRARQHAFAPLVREVGERIPGRHALRPEVRGPVIRRARVGGLDAGRCGLGQEVLQRAERGLLSGGCLLLRLILLLGIAESFPSPPRGERYEFFAFAPDSRTRPE
jgi:hypothetical protein